jgi:hypothetical protein
MMYGSRTVMWVQTAMQGLSVEKSLSLLLLQELRPSLALAAGPHSSRLPEPVKQRSVQRFGGHVVTSQPAASTLRKACGTRFHTCGRSGTGCNLGALLGSADVQASGTSAAGTAPQSGVDDSQNGTGCSDADAGSGL